jgi:hypothetical protein
MADATRFRWTRACYEHPNYKTCWNVPKFGTWVHDGMKNDFRPGYFMYNRLTCSDALAIVKMPSVVLNYLEMQVWAWSACCKFYSLNLALSLIVLSSYTASRFWDACICFYCSRYHVWSLLILEILVCLLQHQELWILIQCSDRDSVNTFVQKFDLSKW